jgi:single-strand DNA-binding protein
MNHINSVLIEGNLVNDPVLSHTSKGTSMCRFCLSSNRIYKEDDANRTEVSNFDVVVWGRQAEVCTEHLKAGSRARIVGRLKQDRTENPEGNGQSTVHIVAEYVEFKPASSEKHKQVS